MTKEDIKLSAQTWIPVGVAVAGLVSFFWAGVTYSEILIVQRTQSESLRRIETKVDQQNKDAVSIELFKQWIELLKARNTTITVPAFPR